MKMISSGDHTNYIRDYDGLECGRNFRTCEILKS